MQIGSYLKEHRKSRHFTQEQVANELHISRQAISAWENNASFPDLENLVLLSQLYQTSVDSLIGNVTPENTLDVQEQTADLQEGLPSAEPAVTEAASSETPVSSAEDAVNSKLESIFLIVLAIAAFELPFLGVFLLIYVIKTVKSRPYFLSDPVSGFSYPILLLLKNSSYPLLRSSQKEKTHLIIEFLCFSLKFCRNDSD